MMAVSEAIDQNLLRFVVNDDEADDTLSLCDMPLYCDADDCSSSSDVSSSGDEFFEFLPTYHQDHCGNTDHPSPASVWDSRDILFCGKLIPYSQALPPSCSSDLQVNDQRRDQTTKKNKTGVTGSFKKARVISYSSAKCDKWYMLAFGLAKFPSEMALSEIRRRQKNRNTSNRKRADGGEIVSAEVDTGMKGKGRFWGLLKALGCSRRDHGVAGTVVKASFGCIPRL